MRMNDDGKTVAAMDVLAPGIGEIIGGSQREERLDVLDRRLAELNLDPKALLVVPRPAPLRHRAARRLRPRPRAHDHLRDRHGEHPRRDPVPAHARATRRSRIGPISVSNFADFENVTNVSPAARAPWRSVCSTSTGSPVSADLEHQRAVVADLLRLHHRGVPVDRARVRHAGARRASRRCRARASSTGGRTASRSPRRDRPSSARGRSPGRRRRRGRRAVPRSVRRALAALGQRVRDHFERDADVRRASRGVDDLLDAAPRGIG